MTERERALTTTDAKLRESEERFRAIFESSPVAIGIAQDGIVRYVNRSFLKLYGYDREEEVVGSPVIDHLAPEVREKTAQRFRDRKAGIAVSPSYETIGLRKDGSRFPFRVNVASIRLPSGDGVVAFETDITEEKKAQEALRLVHDELQRRVDERTAELTGVNAQLRSEIAERIRSEEDLKLFREIVAHASDAISVSDGRGLCIYQNSAHRALVGYSDLEREGKSPSMYIPNFSTYLREIDAKGSWSGQVQHHTKHGEIRTMECSAFGVRKADGTVLCYVAIKRDITDRLRGQEETQKAVRERLRAFEELKRAQGHLIRSEKLASIGMLIAGLAHEINNPLHVIQGNLELLTSGRIWESAPPRVKAMLRDAFRASVRTSGVMRDFRTFARDTVQPEAVDLNACLSETLVLLRRYMGRRIRVVKDFGDVPPVQCIRSRLGQVFLNILKNAAESIEGRGSIVVRTSAKGARVFVEIGDSGRGMSAAVRKKIFEPFFTTKPVGKGMGLGLAISALIVQNHDGAIRVKSRLGKGTTFQIALPVEMRK
jgi:PAS domain S-box-containing protein